MIEEWCSQASWRAQSRRLHLQGLPASDVSFIHVVIEHDIDEPDSLQAVPAFQAFVAGIADRCDVPPVATGATIVGGYR